MERGPGVPGIPRCSWPFLMATGYLAALSAMDSKVVSVMVSMIVPFMKKQ